MTKPLKGDAGFDRILEGAVAAALRDGSMIAGEQPSVFISYSRKDIDFVDRLDSALIARSVQTLVDRSSIEVGERWFARLQDLISRAETIVFVLSPDSVQSKVCAEEVSFGKRLGKRFIPVVARRVDHPSVPEALSELNYVFLDDPTNYEGQVDRLVKAIQTDLGWLRTHADLGRGAEEWVAAERPRGLLLSATRLRDAEVWIANRPANAPLPTGNTIGLVTASRRAAQFRRNVLIGALTFGLIVAIGLASLAFSQRVEAQRQAFMAEQRRQDAAEQRDIAQRNFGVAKDTVRNVIFDLALGLRSVDGIRTSVLRTVLTRVDASIGNLTRNAPDDADIQRMRSIMLTEFGRIYDSAGDPKSAREAYDQVLVIARDLLRSDPNNPIRLRDLEIALDVLGSWTLAHGRAADALETYDEWLGIARQQVRLDPNSLELQRELAVCLERIGHARVANASRSRALEAFNESLQIRRRLTSRQPENATWQHDLGASLQAIAKLKIQGGEVTEAIALYNEMVQIGKTLVQADPDNVNWQADLANALVELGDIEYGADNSVGANQAFKEVIVIRRGLARRNPENTRAWEGLAEADMKIGSLQLAVGDVRGAKASLEEATEITRRLVQIAPNNISHKSNLATNLDSLGEIEVSERNKERALSFFQDALTIRRAVINASNNVESQRGLAITLDNIGNLKFDSDDINGALQAFEEALALFTQIAQREPNDRRWQVDLAVSLINVGRARKKVGNTTEALSAFKQAADIRRRLVRLDPANADWKFKLVESLSYAASAEVQRSGRKALLQDILTILTELQQSGKLPDEYVRWIAYYRGELAKI